ncbi:ketoacyl-synt-domain-containing protein [Periconia macrospinosa]|uniref:Ketoacyl-synt-domain-containing protein n=1 Tax=Periconia macrospinosa TaxID=97972 RepID=A0A2V1D3J7_9PLEO|nr:ketoacyl-synt-domain-containing protein [Periconia macrospinosa]
MSLRPSTMGQRLPRAQISPRTISVFGESQLSVAISNALNTKVERGHTGPAPGKFQDSKIAIVGFSGRFPEAASNDELWEVLKAARDCHRTIPEDRYDWEAHYDADGKKKNHSRIKFGCFINDPGVFDARFFNLSPREAQNTDPAQRLALMSAYEAMEMAGLVPDRTASTQRDRIGVFFGVTSDDWREVNSGQDIDTYFIPGGNRVFVPGRISYFFRLSGPSISVDTACSSSFAAISTACNYLWQGDCDSAIAGGTNVMTNPDNFVGLDRGHFLSATGNCNPFDDSASGYCRADAVGAVVLKRVEDAVADGDPIFGVIAGCSTNHCGQTVSITRPHEGDQLSLFRRILRHTNTDPTDISYVEMHGTGTQAGDAAEMRSVLSAFASDHRRSSMQPKRPLHLGAVKANVGHAESASGVTALIKVLMMMQHSEIPPHRLDGALNRNYPDDMAERNVHIPFKATAWRREDCPGQKRMAFLNNFSAAGGNTAVLLEDAPLQHDITCDRDARDVLPVTVTARTSQSLTDNLGALVEHLQRHPDVPLPALSYTTTARRAHHKFRVLVSGASVKAITSALQRRLDAAGAVKAVKPVPPNVAFAFTGQGTLYAGIAKQLYHHVAMFRSDLVRFDRIARRHGFPSFLSLISGPEEHADAHEVDSVVAHLAVTCVQMALAHLWRLWTVEPSCVTGHSLGEYAALYTARVLSASDTIYLVGSRAQLLVKHCSKSTHAMLAVKAPATVVDDAIDLASLGCAIACINSPVSTTISGPRESIQYLSKLLQDKKIDVVPLDVPYAFHSAQVDPILNEYEQLANCVHFHEPAIPYMSPLLSKMVTGLGVLNASYLVRATRHCVNFQGAIDAARETKMVNDSTIWLELGTHPACSGMVKQIIGTHVVTAPTLRRDGNTWKLVAQVFDVLYHSGIEVQWSQFHHGFPAAQRVLALPSYKWSLERYWIQYRHNFCLTKGDDPLTLVSKNPSLPLPPSPVESLSSSVHRIIEENTSTEAATLLVESDLHEIRMAPIVSGHKVNTAMLCPSSLYADMAFTIAKRMLKTNDMLHEKTGLDCGTMNIKRPLVMHPHATSQLLRVSAEAMWLKNVIHLTFFSVDANARILSEHATCTVKVVQDQAWRNEWKRNAYLISSRVSSLCEAVDRGSAHKLKRGLVYKLFSSLVDYSQEYQGMEQVILDSESLEATAQVKFQVGQQGFDWNPCWIDSLGHIAGFIMNGSENICAKDQVFINHGWDAMRYCRMVEYGKTYTTYNRMQLETGTMYVGDTYIFDGQEVIAVFEGVRFQGVNRSVLDHLLPGKTIPDARPKPVKLRISRASEPKLPPISTKSQPNKAAGIMKIIVEEAQINEGELDLDAEFNDLGVDSLLSLTIVGRLQDELGIEMPTSAFMEHPTIKAFIIYAGGEDSISSSSAQSASSTPILTELKDEEHYFTDATSVSEGSVDSNIDIVAIIQGIISEETGTNIDEISVSTPLAELGVDSLLGLTIMGRLSEEVDKQLPASLFVESETLEDVEAALSNAGLVSKTKKSKFEIKRPQKAQLTTKTVTESVTVSEASLDPSASPHATSVLLQGSSKQAKKILFLFPDGAGSATSYHALADVSPDVVVYGLNCPWLKTPQDLKCSLEHYVAKFLIEVQRRQPQGPYHFGGVSAGGILAYEAAQQLEDVGQKVDTLILLDTPNPVGLENPNSRLYDFLDSLGMFGMGAKQAPKWLRPHFDAFLALLDAYEVRKFGGSSPPTTHIIYARDGMCKHESDPRPEILPNDPREMLWLLNNRTDFTGAGWNSLLGKADLHVSVLDDVNHYTIMQPGPQMQELSKRIACALRA